MTDITNTDRMTKEQVFELRFALLNKLFEVDNASDGWPIIGSVEEAGVKVEMTYNLLSAPYLKLRILIPENHPLLFTDDLFKFAYNLTTDFFDEGTNDACDITVRERSFHGYDDIPEEYIDGVVYDTEINDYAS